VRLGVGVFVVVNVAVCLGVDVDLVEGVNDRDEERDIEGVEEIGANAQKLITEVA